MIHGPNDGIFEGIVGTPVTSVRVSLVDAFNGQIEGYGAVTRRLRNSDSTGILVTAPLFVAHAHKTVQPIPTPVPTKAIPEMLLEACQGGQRADSPD